MFILYITYKKQRLITTDLCEFSNKIDDSPGVSPTGTNPRRLSMDWLKGQFLRITSDHALQGCSTKRHLFNAFLCFVPTCHVRVTRF